LVGASCAGDDQKMVSKKQSIDTHHQSTQYSKSSAQSNASTNTTLAPQLSMLYGSTSKIIASLSTYPYQVVKSRLQQGDVLQPRKTAGLQEHHQMSLHPSSNNMVNNKFIPKYTGTIDCMIKIWKLEGFFGFFRGALPSSLRSAPAAGITLLVYEETLRILRNNDSLRYNHG